ncbi:MAG: DUF4838 domain-containing protein [Verrucomicrobia bacterium]|nr:DUF4838 domain-containing protein [Verrucomicrobiota bacterium]
MTQKVLSASVTFLLTLATVSSPAQVAENQLKLVDEGKPVFTIVVPDGKDPLAMSAANALASAVELASGAKLPIVEENQATDGPNVFIGMTRAAEKAGLRLKELSGLSCVLKVAGGNLFLAGHDQSKNIKDAPHYLTPASKKAVHIFLHDYVGARWLWPNTKGLGTHVPTAKTISFPGKLDHGWKPSFDWVYNTLRTAADYEFNSDYLSSVASHSYGGHSYYSAVPKEKYEKTHPEYFALISGVRNSSANHLCISNPDVRQLLYAEMLKRTDEGFSWVQLAQTDGYIPCECDPCKAIHADPGERLWIVHNKLAQRLERERPSAKAVILSYGPTAAPPKTIPRFGKNVVIELCDYSNAAFEAWRGKADAFTVYVYNWGAYSPLGFAPKTTPRMIAQQVKFFRDHGVRGIYCCGLGESWGLEGPVYYIFNQCLDNPDCDWKSELDSYYRAAFGRAYGPMKQMYDAMFERLELLGARESWTPVLNGYSLPGMPGTPETQYSYFFPPDLLKKMESKLERAKELEPSSVVRTRIDFVERSFQYVQDLANIYHLYHAYQITPNWQTFDLLAAAIKQRSSRVRDFFAKGNGKAEFDGFPTMFPYQTLRGALDGGHLAGILGAPVNWDVDGLKEKKVLPGVGRKKISVARTNLPIKLDGRLDEEVWSKAENGEFVEINMGRLAEETKVRLCYDGQNFYIVFECSESLAAKLPDFWKAFGHDGGLYGQDCIEIFLDPYGQLSKYFHFICSAVPNSYYEEAFGLHEDPLHPLFNQPDRSWNGKWSYGGRIDAEKKCWIVEVAIPHQTLGVTPPTAGTVWKMNLGRERFVQNADRADPELSLWSPNLETRVFHSFEAFGDVIFR